MDVGEEADAAARRSAELRALRAALGPGVRLDEVEAAERQRSTLLEGLDALVMLPPGGALAPLEALLTGRGWARVEALPGVWQGGSGLRLLLGVADEETARRALAAHDYLRARPDDAGGGGLVDRAEAWLSARGSAAFFAFFEGLDRQGPGEEGATRRALASVPLPPAPRILDLGCGTGASTRILAELVDARTTAVDASAASLTALKQHLQRVGLQDRVETRLANFATLDVPPGSVDLLWSEGAIYVLGWRAGLRAWAPLVRPGGCLAITECTWTTDLPPEGARAFWAAAYPSMGTVASNLEVARGLGLEVLECFPLGRRAWEAYYHPLSRRAQIIGASWVASDELRAVASECADEIAVWNTWGSCWDYVFYVLRRPAE